METNNTNLETWIHELQPWFIFSKQRQQKCRWNFIINPIIIIQFLLFWIWNISFLPSYETAKTNHALWNDHPCTKVNPTNQPVRLNPTVLFCPTSTKSTSPKSVDYILALFTFFLGLYTILGSTFTKRLYIHATSEWKRLFSLRISEMPSQVRISNVTRWYN